MQERPAKTVAELARLLYTTKTTIQRDLDTLAAVFPVMEQVDPRHSQRLLFSLGRKILLK